MNPHLNSNQDFEISELFQLLKRTFRFRPIRLARLDFVFVGCFNIQVLDSDIATKFRLFVENQVA